MEPISKSSACFSMQCQKHTIANVYNENSSSGAILIHLTQLPLYNYQEETVFIPYKNERNADALTRNSQDKTYLNSSRQNKSFSGEFCYCLLLQFFISAKLYEGFNQFLMNDPIKIIQLSFPLPADIFQSITKCAIIGTRITKVEVLFKNIKKPINTRKYCLKFIKFNYFESACFYLSQQHV